MTYTVTECSLSRSTGVCVPAGGARLGVTRTYEPNILAERDHLSYNVKMRLVPTSLYQGMEHFETEWYGNITLPTRQRPTTASIDVRSPFTALQPLYHSLPSEYHSMPNAHRSRPKDVPRARAPLEYTSSRGLRSGWSCNGEGPASRVVLWDRPKHGPARARSNKK